MVHCNCVYVFHRLCTVAVSLYDGVVSDGVVSLLEAHSRYCSPGGGSSSRTKIFSFYYFMVVGYNILGPVSLRQYVLVCCILACK